MATGYEQRWPELCEFVGICCHEDIVQDYPAASAEESVRKAMTDYLRRFMQKRRRQRVEAIGRELNELLKVAESEGDLERAAYAMYCRWDFSPWRRWLESVLRIVNELLVPPKPHPSGQPPKRPPMPRQHDQFDSPRPNTSA